MKRDALPISLPMAGAMVDARLVWRVALPMMVFAVVWIVAWYGMTAAAMVEIWARSETFAHGFVVAPISLWLIWRKRASLRLLSPRPSWIALPALAGAGFAWLLGDMGAVNAVSQGSLVAILVLAVPALLGVHVARALTFPLGFLFFAVPIGEFLLPTLMERTADFTVLALRYSGVPVYREGLQFVIPSGKWSVVEACSGVRYLIASLMTGTLFAYISYRSMWRRWAFVGVAIALPIIANWVRAYMIVMLGHLSDNRIATGVDHLIYGWLFFGVVMLLMFWVGSKWSEAPVAAQRPDATATMASEPAPTTARSLWAMLVSLVAITAIWPLARFAIEPRGPIPAVSLGTIEVPRWISSRAPDDAWEPHFDNPSASRHAIYRSGDTGVGLYIAYYRAQNYDRKLVSSNNVLVRSSDRSSVMLSKGSDTVVIGDAARAVVSARIRESTGRELVAWQWYWIGGTLTSSDAWAKAAIAWSRLTGRGDDSAVIVIYTDEQEATSAQSLQSFVHDAWPAIAQTLSRAQSEPR